MPIIMNVDLFQVAISFRGWQGRSFAGAVLCSNNGRSLSRNRHLAPRVIIIIQLYRLNINGNGGA